MHETFHIRFGANLGQWLLTSSVSDKPVSVWPIAVAVAVAFVFVFVCGGASVIFKASAFFIQPSDVIHQGTYLQSKVNL